MRQWVTVGITNTEFAPIAVSLMKVTAWQVLALNSVVGVGAEL